MKKFKIHKALCSCHKQERWILNKKGECQYGINERTGKTGRNIKRRNNVGLQNSKPIQTGTLIANTKWPTRQKIQKKIKQKGKANFKLQYRRKPTGEKSVFEKIFQAALQKTYPDGPRCACCGNPLGTEARTFFFSHVLAKSTFPLFRLWPINIWLCCLSCHSEWDQGDRSQKKFAVKRFFAEKLKRFYYEIKDLPEEEQKEEMKIFEYEND